MSGDNMIKGGVLTTDDGRHLIAKHVRAVRAFNCEIQVSMSDVEEDDDDSTCYSTINSYKSDLDAKFKALELAQEIANEHHGVDVKSDGHFTTRKPNLCCTAGRTVVRQIVQWKCECTKCDNQGKTASSPEEAVAVWNAEIPK